MINLIAYIVFSTALCSFWFYKAIKKMKAKPKGKEIFKFLKMNWEVMLQVFFRKQNFFKWVFETGPILIVTGVYYILICCVSLPSSIFYKLRKLITGKGKDLDDQYEKKEDWLDKEGPPIHNDIPEPDFGKDEPFSEPPLDENELK